MRILVTGAAGFVGANITQALALRGHHVTVMVKRESDDWRLRTLQPGPALRVAGDLAKRTEVSRAVGRAEPECIVHCAARGGYPRQSDIVDIATANVLGFANLLVEAAAAGCRHVINTGSSSEYGRRAAGPSEASAPAPNSVYAASKAWATWVAQRSMEDLGLPVTTLRLYSVYGYLEDPVRLMPRVCSFGLRGQMTPLARPDLVRDYVWIEDVVGAYVAVLEGNRPRTSAVFNVGSGCETRLEEVAAAAGRVFHLRGEPDWGAYPARAWETKRWFADSRKITRAYGWSARVDLDEGLTRMKRWLEADRAIRLRYLTAAGVEG